ncbi:chaperone protein dnaJ 20 [Pyrus ussuriensis x Pyrus communis]|uniref:Chaperone protein dnaJ 20 n=1 Tax=Pyrus ussuriensis x Pyrus communis TaxID=2448454 RepID=A0A5N5GUQ2_9ROSA|nr:chaperone protein dnaJ 20 [Pyrus ussuriensis x Pyrus communis]
MEISFQLQSNNPMLQKARPKKNSPSSYMIQTISCRGDGLESHAKKANFYEVLSLGSENNIDLHDIKKAYRSMARQFHPDVCAPSAKEESTRKFIELQKAYETLSDPVLRQMYDYQLSLADSSLGLGVEEFCMEVKRSIFQREVWEEQLRGLHKRSQTRRERRSMQN